MHLTAAMASSPDRQEWHGAHMPAEGLIIAAGETACVTFQSEDSRVKQLRSP